MQKVTLRVGSMNGEIHIADDFDEPLELVPARKGEAMTNHDTDLAQWAFDQAEALRHGRIADLDLANLADEIEDLGNSEKMEVDSHLENLLMHLLKWEFQPSHRSDSWRATIRMARFRLAKKVRSGALARHLGDEMEDQGVYKLARLGAMNETSEPPSKFPRECPYTLEQVMDESFFPGE